MLLKKIDHIITGLNTGGAEKALYNLLHGGMADMFDCHVVSLMDEGMMGAQIKALGVPVTSLGIQRGVPLYSVLRKLGQIIQERQPDLIQGWMYHGNLAAWLVRSFSRNKPALIWNIRHSLYEIADEKLLTRQVIRVNRLLSSGVDTLLYNSHLSRKQHEEFGFSAAKSKVIPNGIDVRNYKPSKDPRAKVRLNLLIPEDALVVGHVARFHPLKDHKGFLQAAVKVLQHFPQAHFVLAGREITKANTALQEIIPDEKEHQFHLLGERNDIPDLMGIMDIYCQSSWSEAWSNALGEAMAAGVPCVATNVGDSEEIIGETGIVVPPRDPETLAAGIDKLLMMTPEQRKTLGETARSRIKDHYNLDLIVNQYSSLYSELLSNNSC